MKHTSVTGQMNPSKMKTFILMSLATLTVFTQSCSQSDPGKELRQANEELRLENRELRERVATIDKQLAHLTGRFDELQRAHETGNLKTAGSQIIAQTEAKQRSEVDARLRADQIKQQAVATVRKLVAQMDRLLEDIPSIENNVAAWDVALPKFLTLSKDASLQMNSLVTELDGLNFGHSDEVRLKISGFCNGYQSLPGIGRLVVSSREKAAALRAAADPSKSDPDPGAGEEITMNAQLSVFNATIVECKKLQAEMLKLAN